MMNDQKVCLTHLCSPTIPGTQEVLSKVGCANKIQHSDIKGEVSDHLQMPLIKYCMEYTLKSIV